MTTVELLRAARSRIVDIGKWGQTSSFDSRITSGECAWMALRAAGMHGAICDVADRALARAMGGLHCVDIWNFNDSHMHEDVLAAFDRAIANEEAKEAEWTVPDEFVQAIKETVNV